MRKRLLIVLMVMLILELRADGSEPLVAVIDTGADTGHELLKEHIWKNPGELGLDVFGHDKSHNQIDDDANGFVDDVAGWNFANNTPNVTDNNGHGTHVAGLILKASQNKAKLMILKFYDPISAPLHGASSTARAIKYAVKMGARVINYSAGGLAPDDEERQALYEAQKANVLVIVAAGNERNDLAKVSFFPASYGLPNILTVGALDHLGRALASGNYGQSVEVAAPGENLRSALPGGKMGFMTGTSQATAVVTGTTAQLLGAKPEITTPFEVKRALSLLTTEQPDLRQKFYLGRVLSFN